ncbi:hypothetical protein [Nocardia rhizosphaerae]|uniref:Uncharacterized protein n=1 Tax=Nocardia rhizosphaerae TaxID=1691571 RepID=A0ABV8L880_9NOCA
MLQKRVLFGVAVAAAVVGFAPTAGAAQTPVALPQASCSPMPGADLLWECLIPGLLTGSSSMSASLSGD